MALHFLILTHILHSPSYINEIASHNEMSSEEEKRESAPAEAIPDLIDDDPPPDGGYGWVCCFAMCCLNAGVWGILATYGVYLSYYISHDTFEGTTDIAYSFIGGINFAAAMLVAPFVSHLSGVWLPLTSSSIGERTREAVRDKQCDVRRQCCLAGGLDWRIICHDICGPLLHTRSTRGDRWWSDMVASRSCCCSVVCECSLVFLRLWLPL